MLVLGFYLTGFAFNTKPFIIFGSQNVPRAQTMRTQLLAQGNHRMGSSQLRVALG